MWICKRMVCLFTDFHISIIFCYRNKIDWKILLWRFIGFHHSIWARFPFFVFLFANNMIHIIIAIHFMTPRVWKGTSNEVLHVNLSCVWFSSSCTVPCSVFQCDDFTIVRFHIWYLNLCVRMDCYSRLLCIKMFLYLSKDDLLRDDDDDTKFYSFLEKSLQAYFVIYRQSLLDRCLTKRNIFYIKYTLHSLSLPVVQYYSKRS